MCAQVFGKQPFELRINGENFATEKRHARIGEDETAAERTNTGK